MIPKFFVLVLVLIIGSTVIYAQKAGIGDTVDIIGDVFDLGDCVVKGANLSKTGDACDAVKDVPKVVENSTGVISFTEQKYAEIVGYQPKLVADNYSATVCEGLPPDNRSSCSIQLIPYNKTIYVPIWDYVRTSKIETPGESYVFDTKGCWLCGNKIACLSKKDGYSDNRAEEFKCDKNNNPIIRSGESGFIKNIDTQETVLEVSDVGQI